MDYEPSSCWLFRQPPVWVRVVILALVACLVLLIVLFRYQQMSSHVLVARFFENAPSILPRSSYLPGMASPLDQVLPTLQAQSGDLLEPLRPYLENLPDKYMRDPFATDPEHPYLPLRYGIIQHSKPVYYEYLDLSKPAWFTWSAGPSRAAVEIAETTAATGARLYRFVQPPPYDSTNGLDSRGYLFLDNRGVSLGKIRY